MFDMMAALEQSIQGTLRTRAGKHARILCNNMKDYYQKPRPGTNLEFDLVSEARMCVLVLEPPHDGFPSKERMFSYDLKGHLFYNIADNSESATDLITNPTD